jgi:hypothetical protein
MNGQIDDRCPWYRQSVRSEDLGDEASTTAQNVAASLGSLTRLDDERFLEIGLLTNSARDVLPEGVMACCPSLRPKSKLGESAHD